MIKPNCLRERHTLADFPQFPCPKCEATIAPVDKKLDCQQSAESSFYQEEVDSGPEYYGGTFSLLLRCSNRKCAENIFCVGNFHLTEEGDGPDPRLDYVPAIKPYFFIPTIHVFPLSKDLPEKVTKALLESFLPLLEQS